MGYKLILSKTLLRLHKIFYTPKMILSGFTDEQILEVTECTPDELQACHEKLKKIAE